MRKRVQISGERGRWVATAEGKLLPVIHSSYRQGLDYRDPMSTAKTDGKRYAEFVAALKRETLVILQKDKPGTRDREGYIAIWSFNDLEIADDGSVRLKLVERYAEAAR